MDTKHTPTLAEFERALTEASTPLANAANIHYVARLRAEITERLHAHDDLVAALEAVLQHCVTPKGMPDKGKGRTHEQQAALDSARAALAKARE